MSGLSYLQQGGQPEEQQEEEQQAGATNAAIRVRPVAGKGRFQFPSPSGDIPMGQNTLEAMEEMYQEMLARQTGMRGFLEAAKDAQAWWTPGGAQRAQALDIRGKARQQQTADLFNMRTQIAQYKSAMEDQARFQQEKPQLLGQASALAGFDLQPHEIAMLGRINNRADFNKLLQQFTIERTKGLSSPGAQEPKYPIHIINEDGSETYNEVSLPKRNELIRSGRGFEPGSQRPTTRPGTPETAAPAAVPTAPAAAPEGLRPDEMVPRAAPATQPVNYTFEELSPQQLDVLRAKAKDEGLIRDDFSRPDTAQLFNAMPLEKRKSIFSAIGPDESVQPSGVPAAPSAPPVTRAPAATPSAPPVTRAPAAAPAQRFPTVPEIRMQQEAEKTERAEEIKVVAKEYETFRADAKNAPLKESTASEAIKLLTDDPIIAGLFQRPGVGAAFATLVQTGISAPGGHSIGIKELDEVLFKGMKNVTPEQLRARDRLRTLFNTNSLFAATIMKGQGQITEFERQLLERMVGSLGSTPENLVKIQKVLQARARLDMQLDEKFRQSGLTYNKFTRSRDYMDAVRKYQDQVKNIESEDVRIAIRPAARQPAAVPAYEDAEKERRYQEWKRSQGK